MSADKEKDFIEKVTNVAEDVVNTVVNTTTDIYQKGKQQVELARCRSDIRELYKDLGALEYSLYKGQSVDASATLDVKVRLDELHAKLQEAEAEWAAKKEAQAAEREAKEAARAAARAEREARKEPIEIKFESERCPACNEPRIGILPYCAYCGSHFSQQELVMPEVVE